MSKQITASQYATAKQTIRNIYIKINLLNFDYLIVDSLEGNAIDGSISLNSNTDMRRTCDVKMVVNNSTFNIEAGGKIWLDKYVQILIGTDYIQTNEIAWNNMGIFLINKATYDYDASTRTLSFQGLDLMAKLTGVRNGYILGISSEGYILIPEGSSVRESIISIIKDCGFDNYYVSECKNIDGTIQKVPYDMKFEQGTTWYKILEELKNILPNYQIYFDENGVFRYEPIPYTADDPIMISDDIWENNVLSESINTNFESVKNYVEVWGRVHETEYYSSEFSTSINNNIITPQWGELTLEDYVIVALTLPSTISSDNIYINFSGNHLIKDSSGKNITLLDGSKYLMFSYQPEGYWLYLGGNQAYGVWEDNNPESPFYVNSSIGKISIVLYGNEYDNIISDDLAVQRAKYEIYLRCRLNDTISLSTVPIYWADVNWKVGYTSLNTNKYSEYIIKNINIPLNITSLQSFTLAKFYPLYPII